MILNLGTRGHSAVSFHDPHPTSAPGTLAVKQSNSGPLKESPDCLSLGELSPSRDLEQFIFSVGQPIKKQDKS